MLAKENEFEAAFTQRMLVSEVRRASILAWLFTGLSGVGLIANLVYRSLGLELPGMEYVLVTFLIAAGYEWVSRGLFNRLIRQKREPGRFRFYLNALVETSLPTLTLVGMLNYASPFQVVTSAVTYLYFLFIILSALRLDFRLSIFTGVVAALGYAGVTLATLPQIIADWDGSLLQLRTNLGMRAVLLIAAGVVAGLVSQSIRFTLRETMKGIHERERIVNLFGQHVSPAVVNQLLTQPRELNSSQQAVCILVLDIRKFTTFSEDRAADEVVAYLNRLWGSLVQIVNAHHGIVNKFLGDGFLAVFGAPITSRAYCENAVQAARDIIAEVERMAEAGEIPPTQVGLALHSGEAIVGNIGSDERKEYTVIGDVVNVAFRIEALNKELGSTLLVSGPVVEVARVTEAQRMEPMAIRGRREPVELYRLA